MSKLSEMIWQRGSSRQIMKVARAKYREEQRVDDSARADISTRVALASVHYSLVKRYMGLWLPFALWHMWRAIVQAEKAYGNGLRKFSVDQIDVITTIWLKAPKIFGDRRLLAERALSYALNRHPDRASTKPHTRALLLLTYADLHQSFGRKALARDHIEEVGEIIKEYSSLIEIRQFIRILSKIGFFYIDYPRDVDDLYKGKVMVSDALTMAGSGVDKDQEEKIRHEFRKRGISFA